MLVENHIENPDNFSTLFSFTSLHHQLTVFQSPQIFFWSFRGHALIRFVVRSVSSCPTDNFILYDEPDAF